MGAESGHEVGEKAAAASPSNTHTSFMDGEAVPRKRETERKTDPALPHMRMN